MYRFQPNQSQSVKLPPCVHPQGRRDGVQVEAVQGVDNGDGGQGLMEGSGAQQTPERD